MIGGGFVSTYMDITERKRDEQALLQINENLENMVSERTRKLTEVNENWPAPTRARPVSRLPLAMT